MFGPIGGPELILILVIALIVFGPRKLPEIGKSMGTMMMEFRRATNDFKRTIEDEVEAEKVQRDRRRRFPPPPAPAAPPAGARRRPKAPLPDGTRAPRRPPPPAEHK